MQERFTAIADQITSLERTMLTGFADLRAAMEFGFAKHEARFDRVDRKLQEHDVRFDRLESRFDRLETRVEALETRKRR